MAERAFARELALAEEIALEAAHLVRGYHGTDFVVDSKAGNEPVTEADRAANTLIVDRLRVAFPDDAILSEEIPDDGARMGRSRVWMVDPIDGTSDFIAGDTGFVVMIGLAIDGRLQVGAVAHLLTGRVYWRHRRRGRVAPGSRRHAHDRCTRRRSRGRPGSARVASKTHRTPRVDAVKQALGITDESSTSAASASRSASCSEAARDLYVYTGGRTKIWDTWWPRRRSCWPRAAA